MDTPSQEVINDFVLKSHGDMDGVKSLLQQHPSLINASAEWNETPIQAAAHVANRPMVKFLLEQGAPLDICTAAMLGMKDRVAQFLRDDPGQSAARGAHGIPVLFFPALTGEMEIAELLLAHGAEVNAGAGGNTPLHGAAAFGQTEMVRWLLAHGADPQALNYDNKTPFEVAQKNGHHAAADLLRDDQVASV